MKWTRRFFALGLTLALSASVSCTGADSLTGPQVAEPAEQPSYLLGGLLGGVGDVLGGTVDGVLDLSGGVVGGLLDITGLLTCKEQKYDVEYQTIGPDGGTIRVGNHSLVIPRGALHKYVRITAEQMEGSTNSLRFSPEGLKFHKAATLSMDYRNCENVETPKAVVYTTEELEILEVLRSFDLQLLNLDKYKVVAPIDHFSRYALAY